MGEWMRRAHVVLSQMFQVLGLVALGSAILLVQKYLIPHLAQVRLAGADEQLGFPLSGAYGNLPDSQGAQVDAKSAVSDEPRR